MVFEGMDGPDKAINHHASWNCPTCTSATPDNSSTPFGFVGLTYLAHSGDFDSVTGLTFNATVGKVCTVLLGGHELGRVFGPTADYALSITAAPVPAAVWLFGSALRIGVDRSTAR